MTFEPETARLLARMSRIAYRDQTTAAEQLAQLGLEQSRFFDGPSTQAIVATDHANVYLAFRGTEKQPIDWAKNAQFEPIPGELGGRVHKGFHLALNEVWNEIAPIITDQPNPVLVTGHSLGGALAVLAAARLIDDGRAPAAVYTYGQPRVGRKDFAGAFDARLRVRTHRMINHVDPVPRVPLLMQGYRHVGLRMYWDGSGRFHHDAPAWKVALDDIRFRLSHWGRIQAVGLGAHDIAEYESLVDKL